MPYNQNFYSTYQDASARSASKVLPHVLELVKPKTVVDVGCGIGTWLSVALRLGVEQVRGVDGDYVERNQLLIPTERFTAANLAKGFNLPTGETKFDLAMSMEVAEHLPASDADGFVARLTSLSDAVLFSAAIPKQGGTGHINEQWPTYWSKKFAEQGFVMADVVRPQCWEDPEIAYYYAQNSFLYVRQSKVQELGVPAESILPPDHWSLEAVHPQRWRQANDPKRLNPWLVLRALPHVVRQGVRGRINRVMGKGF